MYMVELVRFNDLTVDLIHSDDILGNICPNFENYNKPKIIYNQRSYECILILLLHVSQKTNWFITKND